MTTQKYVTEREKNHCYPQLKLPELKKLRCKINNIPQFVSSVRSSSVHHGLLHTYIQTNYFKFGAILPIYIHNLDLDLEKYSKDPTESAAIYWLQTQMGWRSLSSTLQPKP